MHESKCECEYLKEKEAIEERNHKHNKSLEELKALVQELTAKLIETERELKDLRVYITPIGSGGSLSGEGIQISKAQ